MKRTPLFDGHMASNAKLVDFSGWEMPIHYSGVVDEYQTVRTRAGLFDVSHMGRIAVAGDGALPLLQRLTTRNVAKLRVHESHYSMVCNQRGGIKDDIFINRVKPQEFLLCVNASNRETIVAWLQEQGSGAAGVEIQDRSAEIAQLALQGPASRSILVTLGVPGLAALKPRQCLEVKLLGAQALVTRTGYTGELGYELYVPATGALRIWNELLTNGKAAGLKPVGLGARDLLRLEMAYLLYGNDIREDTTRMEASAEWGVDFQKGEFIGRGALRQQTVGSCPSFGSARAAGAGGHQARVASPAERPVCREADRGSDQRQSLADPAKRDRARLCDQCLQSDRDAACHRHPRQGGPCHRGEAAVL